MKLKTLKEAKYTSSSKSLKALLQFFVEQEGMEEGAKVFYVHEKFLARHSIAEGGNEVVSLTFLDEKPDNVVIMYSDGDAEGMLIQKALAELAIYRCERVY